MDISRMTPEQMLAQAEALKQAAAKKADEQKNQAAREEAERKAAEERIARRAREDHVFQKRLLAHIQKPLADRGVNLFINELKNFHFKATPSDTVPEGIHGDPNIAIRRQTEVGRSGRNWRRSSTETGRYEIIIGDYGKRVRFVEKKDGSLNVQGIVDAVYSAASQVIAFAKSQQLYRTSQRVVEGLNSHFPGGYFSSSDFKYGVAYRERRPVTFRGKALGSVDFDGDVEIASRLVELDKKTTESIGAIHKLITDKELKK